MRSAVTARRTSLLAVWASLVGLFRFPFSVLPILYSYSFSIQFYFFGFYFIAFFTFLVLF
jgi:hypothetical protein